MSEQLLFLDDDNRVISFPTSSSSSKGRGRPLKFDSPQKNELRASLYEAIEANIPPGSFDSIWLTGNSPQIQDLHTRGWLDRASIVESNRQVFPVIHSKVSALGYDADEHVFLRTVEDEVVSYARSGRRELSVLDCDLMCHYNKGIRHGYKKDNVRLEGCTADTVIFPLVACINPNGGLVLRFVFTLSRPSADDPQEAREYTANTLRCVFTEDRIRELQFQPYASEVDSSRMLQLLYHIAP